MSQEKETWIGVKLWGWEKNYTLCFGVAPNNLQVLREKKRLEEIYDNLKKREDGKEERN